MSTTAGAGTREAIRAELETTRQAYHALVDGLSDADWQRRAGTTRRTAAQVAAHITSYLDRMVPLVVRAARQGKKNALPPLPGWLENPANYLLSVVFARGQSRSAAVLRYDAAHRAALALLDGIRDDEWTLATTFPAGHLTLEQTYRHHAEHFAEHAGEIRSALSRR